jgi:hypothetical protein
LPDSVIIPSESRRGPRRLGRDGEVLAGPGPVSSWYCPNNGRSSITGPLEPSDIVGTAR